MLLLKNSQISVPKKVLKDGPTQCRVSQRALCTTVLRKPCLNCGAENELSQIYCRMCAGTFFQEELRDSSAKDAEKELLELVSAVKGFNVPGPVGMQFEESFGIVF